MAMVRSVFLKILPFLVIGLVCFGAGFFWQQGWEKYRQVRLSTSDEVVMETLSTMIVLPEELPSIATVSDKSKLSDQPFFTKAENGDKVIIYKENKRAYLFRPSERKIIDMTVIAVESGAPETVPVFQKNEQ